MDGLDNRHIYTFERLILSNKTCSKDPTRCIIIEHQLSALLKVKLMEKRFLPE